jgi:hypothetical protein
MPFRHVMTLLGISYFLVVVGSSSAPRNEKSGNLNGVHLKFAATHVSQHYAISLSV